MELMHAAQTEAIRERMVVKEIPVPEIGEDEALVRVVASGICRTDWHVWNAAWNFTTPGSGGFAQFARVPNADLNCIPLPDNVTERDGAALGCRYMTAYRAVRTQANVRAGETVLVVGIGGVGRSAVQIAVAMGGLVIAVDAKASALAAATDLGAVAVVDASGLEPEELAARIREANGGIGVEVAIDAMGGRVTTPASLAALAKGGRLVVAGLTTRDDKGRIDVPIDEIMLNEWSVTGTLGNPHGDDVELLQLVNSGRLQPSRLIGAEVSLSDVPAVFGRLEQFETEGFTIITDFN